MTHKTASESRQGPWRVTVGIHAASTLRKGLITACVALTLVAGALQAQDKPDLSSLSVDDLMNVEVTSVSRKGQKVSDTAAAVFVITQDDIRRSGATSIPEVLRIVPGLDVARINGNVWAISARGANGEFANKLLVLIDGRSVYTPLFSGVYWDAQDTLLEDVDRIEVIRGPGGTLWGANAVNGIINVITKHAIETQGTLVTAGEGAAEGPSAAARYGSSAGRNAFYRVFGKTFDRPASVGGVNATHDAWTSGRGGFRADWTSLRGDTFTAQGDAYSERAGTVGIGVDPANPFGDRVSTTHLSGEDIQFRWTAIQSPQSDTTLQAFYDHSARSDPGLVLGRGTFDLDFQHHLRVSRHDAVWGLEYRRSVDNANGPGLQLIRGSNVVGIASAFVQDEIQATRRIRVTVGTKLQYESESRLQLQPTLRVLFKASERQTIWAAATSAVRTPSEAESFGDFIVGAFPAGPGRTGFVVVRGSPGVQPERTESYELGYRWQASPRLALDATAFHNQMRNFINADTSLPFTNPSGLTTVEVRFENNSRGHADGAEVLVTDAIASNWNVDLGYSFIKTSVFNDLGSAAKATTPRQQVQLRSSVQVSPHLELDSAAYYVGRIGSDVKAFVRLDAQFLWHMSKRWEVGISGQNLLAARHAEFVGTPYENQLATPVQRTVNGKITWRY